MQVASFTYKRKGFLTKSIGDSGDQYYLDGQTMEEHVASKLAGGWELVTSAADGGHLRIGRTVAGAALTGGLSLLLGGSRSKASIVLTFKKG